MIRDEYLWVEKYRPKTIEDCVLPANLKKTFQQFVNDGNIPNLLLSGRAGIFHFILDTIGHIPAQATRRTFENYHFECVSLFQKIQPHQPVL